MRQLVVSLALVAAMLVSAKPAVADPIPPSIPHFDPHDPAAQLTPVERRLLAAKERIHTELQAGEGSARGCDRGVCSMAGSGGGGSYPYSVVLNVQAYQQQYCNWCAPAATQEVQSWNNNFAWANSQSEIASYEGTCFPPYDCGTVVYRARQGLNNYVQPQPANFVYSEFQSTSEGDWWGHLQTDVAYYYMPQIPTVAPCDPDGPACLPDWSTTPYGAGHYLVLDGYWGTSNVGGSVQFEDSSGGCYGSTGRYSTSADIMYAVIMKSNPNHDGNWIIW